MAIELPIATLFPKVATLSRAAPVIFACKLWPSETQCCWPIKTNSEVHDKQVVAELHSVHPFEHSINKLLIVQCQYYTETFST